VAVAGLAIYDMVKSVDRTAVISDIRLVSKSGGRRPR
jgi:cyclic pyranopterin phosphate synthase